MPTIDIADSKKQVVIVGGGPAGLTASYQLSKAGIESIVLEKDHTLGGLSRTVNYKGYYFDIGGHRFFTKIKEVEDIWKEVLGDDLLPRKRLSRIYYNKKFFYYPLRALNALFGLGIWNSVLIMASYLKIKLNPSKKEDNFEQWVSNRFGKRLFKIFFKTYTEKVWGIPCPEIRAEWAAQRIKGLSLITALKNALTGSQNNAGSKRTVIKTLIDEFYYPKYGPGMMWNKTADLIRKNGSHIWLESEVDEVFWSSNKVEGLKINRDGKDQVLSGTDYIVSMPVKELVNVLNPPPAKEILDAAQNLRYRDFLTIALIIKKRDVFPDNWIYIHDPGVKVGRIQNFKNWSPHMVPDPEKTCLGLEYFCFEGDDLWNKSDDQLIELGIQELKALGFINGEEIEEGRVVRMPKAYPIDDSTSHESMDVIQGFFSRIKNLQLIGRNGQHKYNNQDHSMATAMLAADNIQGMDHDLWRVNLEPDYYEEVISEPEERLKTQKILAGALARMDKVGLATALGTVLGLLIFCATLFLHIKGGEIVGPNLQLLSQYFLGYTVSVRGAFIGLLYGFFWGFLFGWLFAYLRNLLIAYFIYRVRKKTAVLRFKDFLDNF